MKEIIEAAANKAEPALSKIFSKLVVALTKLLQ